MDVTKQKLERVQELLALQVLPGLKSLQRTTSALMFWSVFIAGMVGVGIVLTVFIIWGTYVRGQ